MSYSAAEDDEVTLLHGSSHICCCFNADRDNSEGRENVTDVRIDSCELVRDIGKVDFSGELDTVCVVTAVVGLADGRGKGVVIPRMVLADGFRRLTFI